MSLFLLDFVCDANLDEVGKMNLVSAADLEEKKAGAEKEEADGQVKTEDSDTDDEGVVTDDSGAEDTDDEGADTDENPDTDGNADEIKDSGGKIGES